MRSRAALRGFGETLGRIAMLALWTLVLWGTLVDVLVLHRLLVREPGDPAPLAGVSAANAGAGLLALLVWLLLVAAWLGREKGRS